MLADAVFVYDDIVPKFMQDYFQGIIFGKTETTDMYPTVDFSIKYEPTAEENGIIPVSFNHILKSSARLSPHLENFSKLVNIACEHKKLLLKDILYGRVFLTTPQITTLDYYAPHTDLPYPHWVVLYYVNDADGDTVFFDNYNNIITTVTPKKGRIVLFNGLIKHSGGIPKTHARCIVNFDILI